MAVFFHYFLQFFLGGAVIVGISLVTKAFGGKYAAIVYALPLQFTIASVIVYFETNKTTVRELCYGSIFGLCMSGVFIFSLWLFLQWCSFWLALTGAGVCFALAVMIYLRFV